VTFEVESAAAGKPVVYKVAEVLFTSAPGKLGVPDRDSLDVTIVRLEGLSPGVSVLTVAKNLPLIQDGAKVYVVGHPRGSGLQISLQDSRLLDIDDIDCLVHYRTPTDPGSSGSPAFNTEWQVVALHHGGASNTPRLHGIGTYAANEGISLATIGAVWRSRRASSG
jgi:V8-like Glu-specific endopeptidase